jgi:molecular chaperone GrpE
MAFLNKSPKPTHNIPKMDLEDGDNIDAQDNMMEHPSEKMDKMTSIGLLLQNDNTILEQLAELSKKVDAVDRNNKKFLMTASMNKTDELEKRIISMKTSAISILDQVDTLINAIYSDAEDSMKIGIEMFLKGLKENMAGIGLKEIIVNIGDAFDSNIHECVESSSDLRYKSDVIISLIKRGYKDAGNGLVIRPAGVVVNKL